MLPVFDDESTPLNLLVSAPLANYTSPSVAGTPYTMSGKCRTLEEVISFVSNDRALLDVLVREARRRHDFAQGRDHRTAAVAWSESVRQVVSSAFTDDGVISVLKKKTQLCECEAKRRSEGDLPSSMPSAGTPPQLEVAAAVAPAHGCNVEEMESVKEKGSKTQSKHRRSGGHTVGRRHKAHSGVAVVHTPPVGSEQTLDASTLPRQGNIERQGDGNKRVNKAYDVRAVPLLVVERCAPSKLGEIQSCELRKTDKAPSESLNIHRRPGLPLNECSGCSIPPAHDDQRAPSAHSEKTTAPFDGEECGNFSIAPLVLPEPSPFPKHLVEKTITKMLDGEDVLTTVPETDGDCDDDIVIGRGGKETLTNERGIGPIDEVGVKDVSFNGLRAKGPPNNKRPHLLRPKWRRRSTLSKTTTIVHLVRHSQASPGRWQHGRRNTADENVFLSEHPLIKRELRAPDQNISSTKKDVEPPTTAPGDLLIPELQTAYTARGRFRAPCVVGEPNFLATAMSTAGIEKSASHAGNATAAASSTGQGRVVVEPKSLLYHESPGVREDTLNDYEYDEFETFSKDKRRVRFLDVALCRVHEIRARFEPHELAELFYSAEELDLMYDELEQEENIEQEQPFQPSNEIERGQSVCHRLGVDIDVDRSNNGDVVEHASSRELFSFKSSLIDGDHPDHQL